MAPDLDLRLLKVFTTVVKTGSHTRAASVLNVTQSAVSHGMKRLEGQLGCALLAKKGKTVHLTPEGRIFYGQVLRILENVDRAAESVAGRFSDSRGKLTVVLSTAMAQLLLAPVLREFRESYPNISIIVRLEDAIRATRAVEEGDCDLAVVIEEQLPPTVKAHPLFQDQIELIFSPMHPWASRQRLSAAEMSREHFLLYQRESVTFRRVEDFFLRSGVRLSSYVEIPSFEIMKQLARLGLGIALMAPWVAAREIGEGSLVVRPLPRFPVRRKWVAIHHAARQLRQPELTFIGLCKMACENTATFGR
jgi:DNA-binding transcriptional LysR family regulator